MRCDGIRTATKETCGSQLYRCKHCSHVGCNQGAGGMCDKQGFKSTRCNGCDKIGASRPLKDGDVVQAAG